MDTFLIYVSLPTIDRHARIRVRSCIIYGSHSTLDRKCDVGNSCPALQPNANSTAGRSNRARPSDQSSSRFISPLTDRRLRPYGKMAIARHFGNLSWRESWRASSDDANARTTSHDKPTSRVRVCVAGANRQRTPHAKCQTSHLPMAKPLNFISAVISVIPTFY